MRSYIDSDTLHRLVVDAFARGVIVAAIRHGVLLAARSVDPATGHSVLYGRRTTALTWALERTAWRLSRITRFWDRDYYRTYSEEPGQPSGHVGAIRSHPCPEIPADFCDVERGSPHWRIKTSESRGTPQPIRGRHSSSTTALMCRRAGRATPTPSQTCCRRSFDIRARARGASG